MKIVCESCGAKYSIADERVTGKVFKIRCKRCSEVIVVRGDQQAQPAVAVAQPAPSEAQDAVWHVVLDGEQAGPYAPSQLAEMLNSNTIDWEAYVWMEGFDNWLPMRDVPDLVAQITGQAPATPARAQRAASTATLTGQPSMGADPFADDAGGMFGGGASSGAGPDLFARGGDSADSPFGSRSDRPGVLASSAARAGADSSLTGARNENSVLFSLKNLQALATGSSSPSMPSAASERAPGYAGGEGSGLIDIRALASATGMADHGSGEKDELLSLGNQGSAFGALGSPMLAPVSDSGDGSKKTIIWASVAGVGFLSIAAVAVAFILRSPPPAPQAVSMVVPPPAAAAAAQPLAPAPAPAPSEGELAAQKAAAPEAEKEEKRSAGDRPRTRRHEGSSAKEAPSTESEPDTEREERKAPAPSGGSRSIDDLLNTALNAPKGGSKPAPAAAPKSDLPESPTKGEVMSAMGGVKPAVAACGKGQGGVATVTVSVAGATGRVTNAQVDGVTGPAGSCIAQAVRKADFPKFQKSTFKFTFPFKL